MRFLNEQSNPGALSIFLEDRIDDSVANKRSSINIVNRQCCTAGEDEDKTAM